MSYKIPIACFGPPDLSGYEQMILFEVGYRCDWNPEKVKGYDLGLILPDIGLDEAIKTYSALNSQGTDVIFGYDSALEAVIERLGIEQSGLLQVRDYDSNKLVDLVKSLLPRRVV